ncbi:MBL fold metallo-hydrolase [Phytoactinopolyspora mesophila]|uniref:MBL fold metallo-hydrolase n=1 Tax=Phytoactinopolyspora mesophila TaxID=2650750 RepID=A0A7K3M901_9ACTN|nr:MBL fold metallo-hydrolase [Phytoactinopolyspora mesophila]NDL59680.1 MBL fold metallo-hydrolase [Phytoactinopolyspora mesophila]
MEVVPFRTPGLGDQTFLLVHEGSGVLVDPQRDIERFLDVVGERDVELRLVLETHLHNDYASGAEQAALRTGAELVLPAAAAAAYPHTPAFHMEDIKAAGLTVRPIHTPGHTPEHTSYLVLLDGEAVALFSGGSLLVGSAGRADLLGVKRARTLSRLQYGSLRRLVALPHDVELYPTHGGGSFCTTAEAGESTSTVGAEVATNPMLEIGDAERFADEMLGAPLPIPAFYKHLGPANTLGIPPMPPVVVPDITWSDLGRQPEDVELVDIRPREAIATGFVLGSTGIEYADDFGSWTGWLLPYNAPIILIAEPAQDVRGAVTQLAQIGIDSVRGVLRDLTGHAAARFELVKLPEFRRRLADPAAQVLDVRMPSEWAAERLGNTVERFLPDLVTEGIPEELDPKREVLTVCASGRRSTIAATILKRAGYQPVVLDGAGVADLLP